MHNLQDEQFPAAIEKLLAQWGGQPHWLSIEVTESAIAADQECAAEILARLHDMGVWIAIDDFGTGYASFSVLKRLPVDEIKIDKSFVFGITSDAQDAAIVRATIDLGQALGLTVTAEGVESQETSECLTAWGCEVAQGYYYSRPMPAADMLSWIHAQRGKIVPLHQSPTDVRRVAVG